MRTIVFRSLPFIQDDLHRDFPKLRFSNWSVNSPYDTEYQCIAWAACNFNRRWWPWDDPSFYWPDGFVKRPVGTPIPVQEFAEMFEKKFGYEKCTKGEFEWGYQKVAIFANLEGVTHMARQRLFGDEWLSKLGCYEDIVHSKSVDIEGDIDPTARQYGEVVQYMKRTWLRAAITMCLFRCMWMFLRLRIYRVVVPWEI